MSRLNLAFQANNKSSFLVNDTTDWSGDFIRADHELFLITEHYKKTAYQAEPLGSSPLVPALASQWAVETLLDGSYRVILVAAKPWVSTLPYVRDAVVSDNGKLYVVKEDAPAGTNPIDEDFFTEVLEGNDLNLLRGVTNGDLKIGHYLHDARTVLCIAEKAIAYAGEQCGCSDECEAIKDYAWSKMFHDAAKYSMLFGEYEEAGKFIDNVNARCGSNSTNNPCNCS
jgi:hypothetical protein